MRGTLVVLCGVLTIILLAGCLGGLGSGDDGVSTAPATPTDGTGNSSHTAQQTTDSTLGTDSDGTAGTDPTESTPPIELIVGPKELPSGTLTPDESTAIKILFRTNDVPSNVLNGTATAKLLLVGTNVTVDGENVTVEGDNATVDGTKVTTTGVLWTGTLEPGRQHRYDVPVITKAANASLRVRLVVPEHPHWSQTIAVIEPRPDASTPPDGKEGTPDNGGSE